jgi:hypothetical protein
MLNYLLSESVKKWWGLKKVKLGYPNQARTFRDPWGPKVGEWQILRGEGPGEPDYYACKIREVEDRGIIAMLRGIVARVVLEPEKFEIPYESYNAGIEAYECLEHERILRGEAIADLCRVPTST